MPIPTRCPHCNNLNLVADQHVGVPVQCKHCSKAFTLSAVPSAADPHPALPRVGGGLGGGIATAQGPAAALCRLDIGGATSPGRVRQSNEDSFLVQHLSWSNLDQRHEIGLIVVADGMGGHEAGEQASGMVIRGVTSALAPMLNGACMGQFKDIATTMLAETIDYALQEANRSIYRKSRSNPAWKGMGATAAAVLIWDGQALIGHVGDCRVYHQRGDKLVQVTRDHTLVARMVELKQLTPEEALKHPSRSEVTQAVGVRFDLESAHYDLRLAPRDWLLVVCDGLYTQVKERAMLDAITRSGPSAALVADRLVELANQAGGDDNVTAVAVRCY